jgi:murein DD-endopeptidase MepM/ murein hydrolase activator NlpD
MKLKLKALCAAGALVLLLLPIHLPEVAEETARSAVRVPLTVLRGTVSRNATLGSLLQRTISPAGVERLVEAARPAYNLARLSTGQPFGLALGPDGLVFAFTYGIDELRTLRIDRIGDALKAKVLTRQYDVRTALVEGTITSSLFAAVAESGEQDQLALDLAEIFAWDVDFNTELQKGDAFKVAVEKLGLDGRFSRYGKILSAEFRRGERLLRAVRFEGSQGAGYYAPDGTPLRKAFLRSPLKFTRISSGFTLARFHPVFKDMRPHYGIDYAAPKGTPVLAAASGVVSLAGWSGGYGKAVRIRHANGFETLYGHLSRIAVRLGERVHQGSQIGSVGSTGTATGPHLDYRMTRNGSFVNPLKVQSPPAEPIPDEERAAFEHVRERAVALLDAGAPATVETRTASVADHADVVRKR